MGYAEPHCFLGMDAPDAAQTQKELGLCLPGGLAYRVSVHLGQCRPAGCGSGRIATVSRLLNFSPGLEWRFHFRGANFGLRGVLENATDSDNPAMVNNVVDSPEYGTFSEFLGRAFTADPADRREVERGRMPLDEVHTSLDRFRSGRPGFRREYVCALGGPDRDRTGDLFHAMEARSQLRHRPTLRKDIFYSQGCGPLSQTSCRFSASRLPRSGLYSWPKSGPNLFFQAQLRPSIRAPMGNNFPALRCLSL